MSINFGIMEVKFNLECVQIENEPLKEAHKKRKAFMNEKEETKNLIQAVKLSALATSLKSFEKGKIKLCNIVKIF